MVERGAWMLGRLPIVRDATAVQTRRLRWAAPGLAVHPMASASARGKHQNGRTQRTLRRSSITRFGGGTSVGPPSTKNGTRYPAVTARPSAVAGRTLRGCPRAGWQCRGHRARCATGFRPQPARTALLNWATAWRTWPPAEPLILPVPMSSATQLRCRLPATFLSTGRAPPTHMAIRMPMGANPNGTNARSSS